MHRITRVFAIATIFVAALYLPAHEGTRAQERAVNNVYIVQMAELPIASYDGRLGLTATRPQRAVPSLRCQGAGLRPLAGAASTARGHPRSNSPSTGANSSMASTVIGSSTSCTWLIPAAAY